MYVQHRLEREADLDRLLSDGIKPQTMVLNTFETAFEAQEYIKKIHWVNDLISKI